MYSENYYLKFKKEDKGISYSSCQTTVCVVNFDQCILTDNVTRINVVAFDTMISMDRKKLCIVLLLYEQFFRNIDPEIPLNIRITKDQLKLLCQI